MSQYLKIALIPAYNPEECLIQVVQQLSEKGFWILIVDDGSDKEHKPIFQEIDDAGKMCIRDRFRTFDCSSYGRVSQRENSCGNKG